MNNTLALYVHVPFCLSKCGYCDFYSLPCLDRKRAYVSALVRALDAVSETEKRTVESVFFGGGTPSLLTSGEMEEIFRALSRFFLAPDCEITVEVNPATADFDTLCAYRALGVNRISVGMQASREETLRLLGRRHTAKETECCVRDLRRAGFDNFSLDLMYGLPHQTSVEWQESLSAALSLEPVHLSLYALTLSESAPLYRLREAIPSDELQREFYETAVQTLSSAGFSRYEISNFAREGRACRHNLRYWQGGDYLGFGPAASSLYHARRYTEPESLEAFLASPEGLLPRILSEEPMGEEERLSERILLSLRLAEGLELRTFQEKVPDPVRFEREVQTLVAGGFCTVDDFRLALNGDGFFVSNEIISRLLLAAGL